MDTHRKVYVFYVIKSIWFDYSVVQMALAAIDRPSPDLYAFL